MNIVDEIFAIFEKRGDSLYGGEAVTQKEHALQAAWDAEQAGAPSSLIAAALLHDLGHLLHDLPDDAPDQGIDDRHETSGYRWLEDHFGRDVTEPVRLHVAAKRYLCAVDQEYFGLLSEPSVRSLELQGGPFTSDEVRDFEALPHSTAAVELRRYDDRAKIVGLKTPDLEHFRGHLESALRT